MEDHTQQQIDVIVKHVQDLERLASSSRALLLKIMTDINSHIEETVSKEGKSE